MFHGAKPSPSRGAHVWLGVAKPESGGGFRAEPGEFTAVVPTGGMPLHDATGSAGAKAMNSNKIKSMTYDSSSYFGAVLVPETALGNSSAISDPSCRLNESGKQASFGQVSKSIPDVRTGTSAELSDIADETRNR